MRKSAVIIFGYGLLLGQFAYSAESDCRPISPVQGDDLVALLVDSESNALLQINVDEGEVCILQGGAPNLEEANSVPLHISSVLDELAIQATVDGLDAWLRIDAELDGELLLDRKTAEGLDLTAAEFLGDNSQLEASDFFIEFVGALEIGQLRLRNVEANIPLLEVPYDHYEGRGNLPESSSAEVGFLTVGSLGEALLEEFILTVDKAKQRVYFTEVK